VKLVYWWTVKKRTTKMTTRFCDTETGVALYQ